MTKRSISLLLALVMLLTAGCGIQGEPEITEESIPESTEATVPDPTEDPLPDYHFSKLKYVRPDPQAVLSAQAKCEELAQGSDYGLLSKAVSEYETKYDEYETMYMLSMIRYNLDLTDAHWQAEYNHCTEGRSLTMAGREQLLYTLADSAHAQQLEQDLFWDGCLDAYTGVNYWTEELGTLLQEDSRLRNKYFDLVAELPHNASGSPEIEELLAQMVTLRQKIAATAGFDSYPDFSYQYEYGRDYTPREAQVYLEQVRTQVAPLLNNLQRMSPPATNGSALEYVKALTDKTGGSLAEAFAVLKAGELYDLEYSSKKAGTAFSMLLPSYGVPFIFANTSGNSKAVTLTHEFGHFCQEYTSQIMCPSVDTAEVFSQGLEYLSLTYGDGTQNQYQIQSLLNVFVSSAAQADFELRLYTLPEEEITAENIVKLHSQVGMDWGLTYIGGFTRSVLVHTPHYFNTPMYMLSYAISNDVALQFHEMELQEPGSGLACYEKCLTLCQLQLLTFAEEAGLQSPFAPDRVQQVRNAFAKELEKK